jgi:hypothetical protein
MSLGRLVIEVTDYRQEDHSSIPGRSREFCLHHHRSWTDRTHLVSFVVGPWNFVPKRKASAREPS